MKHFFTTAFFSVVVCLAQSQVKTAIFDNGSKINYEVTSTDPDDSPRFQIGLGVNGQNYLLSLYNGNVGYGYIEGLYNHKRFSLALTAGRWGCGVNGVVFFSRFDKQKEKLTFLKQNGGFHYTELYVVPVQQTIRRHLGLHLGYNYLNYSEVSFESELDQNQWLTTFDGLETNELSIGLAFVQKKNVKTVVQFSKPKRLGYSRQFGIYSDFLYYTNPISNLKNSTGQTGARLYAEVSQLWYYGGMSFGYFYKAGLQYGPLTTNIFPVINLGLKVGLT
ncbi:MAG: hypothetical protein ACWA6U_10660 [Breznakibacter sp.]